MHNLSREAGIPCLTWGYPCLCCFDNTQRIQREVYPFSSPWGRAHISSEMCDAIANLQSLYHRHERGFPMALLSHQMCLVIPVDKTLHVNHQLGARPPAVVDGASEQDNSFAAPSRHGSSRYAPLERVDHRANPPTAVVGARISNESRSDVIPKNSSLSLLQNRVSTATRFRI